jgi:hypothetical protein
MLHAALIETKRDTARDDNVDDGLIAAIQQRSGFHLGLFLADDNGHNVTLVVFDTDEQAQRLADEVAANDATRVDVMTLSRSA